MGGKAQRIRDNVSQFLTTQSDKNAELVRVYETIKKLLVHDLTLEAFSDMYAQTLVLWAFLSRVITTILRQAFLAKRRRHDLIPEIKPAPSTLL